MGFEWQLKVKILTVFQKKIKLEDILPDSNIKSSRKKSTKRASTIRGTPWYCTMSWGITMGIRPIWGILNLMISCCLLVNDSKLIDSWDLWLTIGLCAWAYCMIFVKGAARVNKHDLNKNDSRFGRKCVRIFFRRRYLFPEGNGFPRA